jgi:DNA polymerase
MKDPSNPELRGNDRPPTLDEMETCRRYLDMQMEIIQPKIIVTLGASSTRGLLNSEESISTIRGTVKEYNGIKLMPTYHPAALLRNPNLKKFVWDDMKKVIKYLKTGEI